jgi:hypothetical protein
MRPMTSFDGRQSDGFVTRCRSALGAALEEQVLDACLFGRTGSLVGAPTPFGDGMARLVSRRRAGGLPERFALVLTASRLRAYAVTGSEPQIDTGGQLAVWERSVLSVKAARSDLVVAVFLSAADQQIAIEAPLAVRTLAFVRALDHRAFDSQSAHTQARMPVRSEDRSIG